jgi:hypothetical protein
LIRTLNPIKASVFLIEAIMLVRKRFGYMDRRVNEVKNKICQVCIKFMDGVQSEEEMRFYLLELDLDERDSLMVIYDFDLIELIEHPFCQSIIYNIWTSPYDTSHSMFTVSTAHTLLFNYNHCRYDDEQRLRLLPLKNNKDLSRFGCHDYQFQVWRYSGQSRHMVFAVFMWVMVLLYHLLIINHLTEAVKLEDEHKFMYSVYKYKNGLTLPDDRTPETVELQN